MATANRASYLTLDAVPMNTAGWDVKNLEVLWQPADVRGTDLLVPQAHGRLARRRWRDLTVHSLNMVVRGDFDGDGVAQANHAIGLQANVAYLKTNVFAIPASDDGTVAAVLTMPDATTLTGDVHVSNLELSHISYRYLRATFDVSIPAGELS